MTPLAAHQHFEEKTKGSIEVGKLADFAILSHNRSNGPLTEVFGVPPHRH